MCGGKPRAPEIIYQGPSPEEIAAQNQAMELASKQQEQSNALLRSQLDQQIAAANAAMTKQKEELDAQTAAAAADAAARQTGAYSATATQSAAPETAMTTRPVQPRKKATSGLKIASGGTAAGAGAGLNIGV